MLTHKDIQSTHLYTHVSLWQLHMFYIMFPGCCSDTFVFSGVLHLLTLYILSCDFKSCEQKKTFLMFDKLLPNPYASFFVCCVDRLSSNVRIISSLFVILLVFVVTTVLVKVDVSDRRVEFFAGTLASVAVISGASNLFYGSVFGISGHFPMRISQALISGTVLLKAILSFFILDLYSIIVQINFLELGLNVSLKNMLVCFFL